MERLKGKVKNLQDNEENNKKEKQDKKHIISMYEISQNLAVSFDQLQSVCEVYRIVQVFCFIAIRPFHDRLLFD